MCTFRTQYIGCIFDKSKRRSWCIALFFRLDSPFSFSFFFLLDSAVFLGWCYWMSRLTMSSWRIRREKISNSKWWSGHGRKKMELKRSVIFLMALRMCLLLNSKNGEMILGICTEMRAKSQWPVRKLVVVFLVRSS